MERHTTSKNQRLKRFKIVIFPQNNLRIWLSFNLNTSSIFFGIYSNTGSKIYMEK